MAPPRQQIPQVLRLLLPVTLFASSYLAAFAVLELPRTIPHFWVALVSAGFGTAVVIVVAERGLWDVGLSGAPRTILAQLTAGLALSAGVIGVTDGLIQLSTDVSRTPGRAFPWLEIVLIYIPAAVHEELVFRGYIYQKLRSWHPPAAVAVSSAAFAALHARNDGITPVALLNLAVAGVLLCLAYDLTQRLWLPIGIHLGWNVFSGPVLGYGVSGYLSRDTLFATSVTGPGELTGGRFGVEGSLWILPVELAAAAVLFWQGRLRRLRNL